MKRFISLALVFVLLASSFAFAADAEPVKAEGEKTFQEVYLDGEKVDLGAYLINQRNYVKLRDVAALLTATDAKFNVGFENKKVVITTGETYEKLDTDLVEFPEGKVEAIMGEQAFVFNGEEKMVKTAVINQNNYLQLRELGELIGFGVHYNKETRNIELSSKLEEKAEEAKENTEEKKDEKAEEKKEEAKTEEAKEVVDQEEQALLDEEAGWEYGADIEKIFGFIDDYHKGMNNADYKLASDALFTLLNNRLDDKVIQNDINQLESFASKIGADIFKKDFKARGMAINFGNRIEISREYDYGNNSLVRIEYNIRGTNAVVRNTAIKRLTDKSFESLNEKDSAHFKLIDDLYEPYINNDVKKFDSILGKVLPLKEGTSAELLAHGQKRYKEVKADPKNVVKKVRYIEQSPKGAKYTIVYRYANKTYTTMSVMDHNDGYNFIANIREVVRSK